MPSIIQDKRQPIRRRVPPLVASTAAVLIAAVLCSSSCLHATAFQLSSPSSLVRRTPATAQALHAERVTATGTGPSSTAGGPPPFRPNPNHHQHHNNNPNRRPQQNQNLHGGGGLREINNGINFWGKQRDFDKVLTLVQKLEDEGLHPNIYTFHALLNAAVSCKRGEAETRAVWQTMTEEHGLQPTAVTYNIFLKRFFGHRSPAAQRQALAVLDEMRHEGVEPDVLTFNELINICVEGGDMKAATGLLQAMLHRGLRPDATTYTTLIKGHGLKGNLLSAFETVKEMRAQALPLSTYSCNVLADACIRCGQPARALKLYRDFELSQGGREGGREGGRLLDLKSFNIMLKAHREMGHLEGALGTLAALKARGLEADAITYNTLVDAYCKAQKPSGARLLIKEMKAKKVPVTHQTLHPLVQEEITSKGASLEESLKLAGEVLGEHGLRESDVTVCTVMEAMLGMERPADAIKAFVRSFFEVEEEGEEGREEGVVTPRARATPSLVAYNGLIKAYREYVLGLDLEGDAGDMPPLRLLAFAADGSPPVITLATTPHQVFEAILPLPSYLRASSSSARPTATSSSPSLPPSRGPSGPDSITYNVLMDFAAELGAVPALEKLQEGRSGAGFALDHYVIHSLMKAHAVRGDLKGVTEAKEKMEALRVPPNERTFSVLVLSLLRCGQVDKAELLLKNALSRQLYVHDSLFVAFIQYYTSAAAQQQQQQQQQQQRKGSNLASAREIFEAFKTRRVPSSSPSSSPQQQQQQQQQQHGKWTVAVWSAWMGALARTGDLEGVLNVWEEMTTSPSVGLRPTRSTYVQVVRAACEAGEVEVALEWVGRMRSKKWVPDVRVYNGLIYACLAREGVREGGREGGRQGLLMEVLGMMERDGVVPNAITLRARNGVMRVLASRMRSVSDTMVGKLKMLALSKQWEGRKEGGKKGEEER